MGGAKTNYRLGTLLILLEIELKILVNHKVHIGRAGSEDGGAQLSERESGNGVRRECEIIEECCCH